MFRTYAVKHSALFLPVVRLLKNRDDMFGDTDDILMFRFVP